ncbi:hypothetical protein SDC9_64422 [bioreactor metagenome]|uniref:GmrSD restriction endonucleases C-terminal domain-containing protein n=1 Tax=bioreactor metagenome TaxID=1076179 RepID=A0A644XQH3_9ZZZZ
MNLIKSLPENKKKRDHEVFVGTFTLQQIKEEYIVIQMPPQYIVNSYKFGYERDNPGFKYLRHYILGEPEGGHIIETFYTLNLEGAKGFFCDNLKKYSQEYGLDGVIQLFRKATQNLMFNLHEIEDDFDVYVAFETMNNRGKRLSNLELLKNRLIYLTTIYEDYEIKDDERSILRNEINDAWKDVYFQLGRNKERPLSDDDFLMAHWIMYFQYTRKKGSDYVHFLLEERFTPQNIFTKTARLDSIVEIKEVRDESEEEQIDYSGENGIEEQETKVARLSPREISDYVKSLKSAAGHWYNTFHPLNNQDLTGEEQLWLDRLNRIGFAYFRPLVVASYLNKNIGLQDRLLLFKEIERFIFLTFRIGRALTTYRNSEFYRLTKRLRSAEINVGHIIWVLRSSTENLLNAEKALDIQPFRNYLNRLFRDGGGFYWWSGLHYFLYEYEQELVRNKGNAKIDWQLFVKSEKDKVSIEHIYPQTPDDSWASVFDRYNNQQKSYLTGSLGNLLPLSQSKNSSLQNVGFKDKKHPTGKSHKGYSDGSHSEIEVAEYRIWNAKTILERGYNLLDFMERRWDFKFASQADKKAILFLEFVKE